MKPGGFDDPALSSYPTAENLYFSQEESIVGKSPGEPGPGQYTIAQEGSGQRYTQTNLQTPDLMFGEGAVTSNGEAIMDTSESPRGHWSEILNFHGSPAPWILLGLLLVAGMLSVSAKGRIEGGVKL
jgi:hypothetical protein